MTRFEAMRGAQEYSATEGKRQDVYVWRADDEPSIRNFYMCGGIVWPDVQRDRPASAKLIMIYNTGQVVWRQGDRPKEDN